MSLLTVKRFLHRCRRENRFYCHWVIARHESKLRRPQQYGIPTFVEQICYENARNQLSPIAGEVHPRDYFRNKLNQRRFLQTLDAPLPELHAHGSVQVIRTLSDGSYFIKPKRGAGARGAIAISISGDRVVANQNNQTLDHFIQWYEDAVGREAILVEELLQDLHFDHLTDYKVYCFYGQGADHVSCIQRDTHKRGASFLSSGERVDIGKYADHPLVDRPPEQIIKRIADLAVAMSSKIPLSFVRLDFYATKRGIVVGEITPIPGDAGDFTPNHNRVMGEKWIAARALLRENMEGVAGNTYFRREGIMRF